ncbi:MAG: hypothetical protein JW810_10140, partial [Sedimentisphaerales bacterium]|nr:hypothetical protein [Sedimentisphaerales bacterium]
MTDHLEEYLRESAPGVAADYLTLQRSALAEMIKLSADSVAPAVNQIESLFARAKHKVEHQLEQSRQEIETRFQRQQETVRQEHARRTAEIQAAADAERSALEADTRSRQNTVNLGADGQIQEVRKKCEEDILFAETDRDAVIQKSLQERRHIEKAVPAGRQRLQEMREQAEQILEVYRHPRPEESEEEIGDLADTENAQAEFLQQLKSARRYLDILQYLRIPRLFIGTRPFVYVVLLCGMGVGTVWFVQKLPFVTMPPFVITGPMALAVTLAATFWAGRYLVKKGHAQIDAVYEPFQRSVAAALRALDLCLALTLQQVEQQIQTARQTYQEEVARAKDHFQTAKAEVEARSKPALQGLEEKHARALAALEERLGEDLQRRQREFQQAQS